MSKMKGADLKLWIRFLLMFDLELVLLLVLPTPTPTFNLIGLIIALISFLVVIALYLLDGAIFAPERRAACADRDRVADLGSPTLPSLIFAPFTGLTIALIAFYLAFFTAFNDHVDMQTPTRLCPPPSARCRRAPLPAAASAPSTRKYTIVSLAPPSSTASPPPPSSRRTRSCWLPLRPLGMVVPGPGDRPAPRKSHGLLDCSRRRGGWRGHDRSIARQRIRRSLPSLPTPSANPTTSPALLFPLPPIPRPSPFCSGHTGAWLLLPPKLIPPQLTPPDCQPTPPLPLPPTPPTSHPIYSLFLLAPLATFLRPARPTAATANLLLLVATLAAIGEALAGSGAVVHLGGWINALGLAVEWCFAFDGLAVAMFVPIVGVSLLVQLYSIGYMGADPGFARFMGYLAFFTFAMILLVVADNLLVLFLGWEAVGVASYLLINFWFTRAAANLAALKAFLLNRVGDLFLAWAAILALAAIGDASYGALLPLAPFLSERTVGLIAVLLVGAASAKSALAVGGIHVWLPAAMEGPTPVSALIHAATMVTAGIYLFCRFGPLLEWCSTALLLVVALGAVGAIGGAVGGLLEADVKRVVAYSTVSQLGYMAVAAGASHHSLAIFHLANHAFFKALLFLTAGAIIHAVADEQDMRRMGGLVLVLPGFHAAALLGSLSLMAFPFLTGFYSKDLLLELAAVPFNVTLLAAFGLLFAAALFTGLYSVRLTLAAFLQAPRFPAALADGGDAPADRLITLPLLLLAIGAAGFGLVASPIFRESAIGGEAFAALPAHALGAIGEPAGWGQKAPLLLLLLPLAALPVAMGREGRARMLQNPLAAWNALNGHAIGGGQAAAVLLARYFDRGLLELAGPQGLVRLFHFLAFKLELAGTGFAAHYALIFLGGAAMGLGFYAGGG